MSLYRAGNRLNIQKRNAGVCTFLMRDSSYMETLVYPAVTPVCMTKIRLRHPQERKENAKLCSECCTAGCKKHVALCWVAAYNMRTQSTATMLTGSTNNHPIHTLIAPTFIIDAHIYYTLTQSKNSGNGLQICDL